LIKAIHPSFYTQSHNYNGFFKLLESLLQTHTCFISHSTKLRAFPLSAVTVSLNYLPRRLGSTVTRGKTLSSVTWNKPLHICCLVTVT